MVKCYPIFLAYQHLKCHLYLYPSPPSVRGPIMPCLFLEARVKCPLDQPTNLTSHMSPTSSTLPHPGHTATFTGHPVRLMTISIEDHLVSHKMMLIEHQVILKATPTGRPIRLTTHTKPTHLCFCQTWSPSVVDVVSTLCVWKCLFYLSPTQQHTTHSQAM